jgi:hypothetical protein
MQMSTNLIDTYVSEVGRRLPGKNRLDIQAEIRSILQDMQEERSRKAGKPVDEEMTLEVLKEYGSPEKVAATYQSERYLIGPRLYPLFILVLRIVLIVTGVLAAIGLGIALSHTTLPIGNAIETIFKAIGNYATSIMIALGNIVIIFAILEWALFRAGSKVEFKGLPQEKEWDPRVLTRVSTPNQVKMGETIVEIVGCFAGIVIFNFFPQIIGFTPSMNSLVGSGNLAAGLGNLTFVPLLSEAFFAFLPYLTLLWALTIAMDIVLLRMGSWNIATRLSLIGLKIITIVIAVVMLGAPSLLAVTASALTTALGDAEAAAILMTMLNLIVRVALWLTIIGSGIEIIKAVSRLVRNYNLPEIPIKN